jgi:hypothetical protein
MTLLGRHKFCLTGNYEGESMSKGPNALQYYEIRIFRVLLFYVARNELSGLETYIILK